MDGRLTTYPTDTADFLWSANAPHASVVVQVREYAWGEGDVDEAICQFADVDDDATFESYYYLQDGNNNVVGITDAAGAVLVQYQYEPYGNVAIRDVLVAPPTDLPKESLGFQGLFADRHALATTPAPGETALDSPLEPGATVLYLTRNRAYSPELGRFLSRDPNEAVMPVVSALLMNGEAVALALGAFNPNAHYGDGMNLYEFGRSDPVNMRDPLGLSALEDDIDAVIGAISGERAAAASAIAARVGQVVNTAVRIGSTLLSLVPGGDAVKLMYLLASGEPVTMDDVTSAALSIVPGGVLGKIAGKAIGTLTKMLWPYFKKIGGKLAKYGDDFVQGVSRRLGKCSSFAIGTLVATSSGVVPIEAISIGTEVLTRWEANADDALCYRPVTEVSARLAPGVAYVTLDDGSEIGVTPEHLFWNATLKRWTRLHDCAVGDTLINIDGSTRRVIAIRFEATPTLVYNLEVDATHTYFAEGTWVHNCPNLNWSAKSRPTFQHTFTQHGQKKKLQSLIDRARAKNTPQGQWLDDDEAAKFLRDVRPAIDEVVEFPIPPGVSARVIMPNGSIVQATMVRLVPNTRTGGYITAFPMP